MASRQNNANDRACYRCTHITLFSSGWTRSDIKRKGSWRIPIIGILLGEECEWAAPAYFSTDAILHIHFLDGRIGWRTRILCHITFVASCNYHSSGKMFKDKYIYLIKLFHWISTFMSALEWFLSNNKTKWLCRSCCIPLNKQNITFNQGL